MSSMPVQFPATFKPGARLVVPGPRKSAAELVIVCRREVKFESAEEFYEHCSDNPHSPYFAYALRIKPN